ncbi:MAG: sulfatase activating formylglycine-generating enzyme [Verrucomicrobiales bacterium]
MKLALLPPGEFTMGRTEEQFDEILALTETDPEMRKHRGGTITWSMLMMPAHRVRITKPFYMGAHEITVAQFREFAEATGYQTEAEQGLNHGKPYKGSRAMSTWRKPMAWRQNYAQADDEPVLHLGWVDCVAFCEWLSKKEGREYVLPTEAEWEYGCRAGTTTSWHFGGPTDFDQVAHEYAWWSDGAQDKHETPRAVGRGKPNAFGLYDMHGNVWEYTADWWHRLSYKDAPLNNPTGPATQSEKGDGRRIIRGSSFDWGRWGGDSAYRMRITQRSNQHPHMGFRVAMRIEGEEGAPLAVDPDDQRREQLLDPGIGSEEVKSALSAGGLAEADFAEDLTIELGNDVEMEFALIPAGSFLMGSNQGSKDEQPVHRVVISKPFYMARHELTQSQWQAVMGEDKRLTANVSDDNDMTGPTKAMNALSWDMCQDYIGKLRQKATGQAFALPTEAQWEYACRAGSETEFHFGDDPAQLGEYAWFQGNAIWPGMPAFEGLTAYHDTGVKKPNAWGLHDMHGGVWEWCQDRYDAGYYFDSPLADPAGPDSGRFRVIRGGSWFRYAKYARSSYRRFFHPESDSDGVTAWILDFGCRLVINLDQETSDSVLSLAENLVKHEANPVLDIGKPGEWDADRTGCFSITQIDGRLHLYYMGSGGDQPWRIGLATSGNGVNWRRSPANPVLPEGKSGNWDDRQVSMPAVYNDNGKLRMWYSGAGKGGGFGLATSPDGVTWERHGGSPVLRGTGGSMDPCVRRFGDQFVMWYCGKLGDSYRILRATSPDGIQWTKDPEAVLPLGEKGDFDEVSQAGPVVLKVGETFYLFHLGGSSKGWKMGLASSPDGVTWTKSAANPVLDAGAEDAWDGGSILSHDILFMDGAFHVWYAAHSLDDAKNPEHKQAIRIGYAVSNSEP